MQDGVENAKIPMSVVDVAESAAIPKAGRRSALRAGYRIRAKSFGILMNSATLPGIGQRANVISYLAPKFLCGMPGNSGASSTADSPSTR